MGNNVVSSCDLRVAFGAVRDQGTRPTCIAFALSDAHRAARGNSELLSAEHIFFHAAKRTPSWVSSQGVPLDSACDALRVDGQAAETGWPYLKALPADLTTWMPPSSATPVFSRETSLESALVADLVKRLDNSQSVVLIMLIGERFFFPVDNLVSAGPNDADAGYHAVIAVGHGKLQTGERCVLVRNSWGPTWGDSGHAWVTEEYMRTRINAAIVMGIGGVP